MTVYVLTTGLILFALLVGALVPLIVATYRTVRRADSVLATLETRGAEVLDRADAALSRAETLGEELTEPDGGVTRFVEAVDGVAASLEQLQEAARLPIAAASAIGPALAAAMQAYAHTRRAGNGQGHVAWGSEGMAEDGPATPQAPPA